MSKHEFAKELANKVADKLGMGYDVSVIDVPLGTCMTPKIVIRRENEYASPTFGIEEYWEDRSRGTDLLATELLKLYESVKNSGKDIEQQAKSLTCYESAKDMLRVKLINKRKNTMYLKDVHYKTFLDDFAIIPYLIVVRNGEMVGTALVKNDLLNLWNKNFEEVFQVACDNTKQSETMKFNEMSTLLPSQFTDEFPALADTPQMYVMTNTEMQFGAVQVVFHSEQIDTIAEQTGGAYVIFSSIHEVIIITDTYSSQTLEYLSSMNREVNKTMDEREVLGERAYYYQLSKGFIE